MSNPKPAPASKAPPIGGVIHTYQKYDPQKYPGPLAEPPDVASAALEHMLAFGDMREFTDEELANAVRIDPSQIAGLGPSIQSLLAMLRAMKQKILSTYETRTVHKQARKEFEKLAGRISPPDKHRKRFDRAVAQEQIYDLERIWYSADRDHSAFAGQLVQLIDRLGDKYQIDDLHGKYQFTGRSPLTIPEAIDVKERLETIDRLIKQLEEAAKTARVGVIDLEELAQFADSADLENLQRIQKQVEEYLRDLAKSQGLDRDHAGYRLTPKAYRLFQGRLLERIFQELQPSRTGRHAGPVVGEGAVELQQTRQYEFGDSLANMDIPGSMINALVRSGPGLPVRFESRDIDVHRTRNTPKCATVVLLDMSGSMRYEGLYVNVKRMGLALDGLIRKEFPGDYLQFVEVYTFAKPRLPGELVALLPKMPTLHDPVVRLRADMSRPGITEMHVPQHFTNIQHGLQLARRFLATQDTPNRQIILITDGLPTAHFEREMLYLLYPADSRTENATLREGKFCQRDGITINIFLLPSWMQSREDVHFAYKLARSTKGRVFFTAGKDLDRYVVWDYLKSRREIVS